MMNRSVMQRQMFKDGGAAGFPDLSGDGKVTQKDILMGRGVPMQMGGEPAMAAAQMGAMPPMAPPPAMAPPAMAAPAMTPPPAVAPAPEMGGDVVMPEGMGVGQIDPAQVESFLAQIAPAVGDPEEAESFEEMMNLTRGDVATVEERRAELASIVGEEDAQQTPDSVLAMLQPIMLLNAAEETGAQGGETVDQGIGGLAEQEMQQPVQGDMAGGIMSMMGG